MQKFLIGLVVVIVILVGGFYLFNNYIYQEKQAEVERETISGVVTNVNREAITYDGPSVVTIRTDAGATRTIEVPSMGLPLCEAYSNITDVSVLEIGDRIEVTGDVNPDTQAIVPCHSVEHYLRAAASFTDPNLGISFTYRRGPEGYVLQTAPHGNEEEANFEELYILMLKADYDLMQTLEGTEGPPTINVAVYKNTAKQDPLPWAQANQSVSNIKLAKSEPQEAVVGSANAIRYTVDGLYRADTLVVTDGGYVFVVSGAYATEEDTVRQDFASFLNSITFVQRSSEN